MIKFYLAAVHGIPQKDEALLEGYLQKDEKQYSFFVQKSKSDQNRFIKKQNIERLLKRKIAHCCRLNCSREEPTR